MILRHIEIKKDFPPAFKDRNNIEYVYIRFEDISFSGWAHSELRMSFQITKGMRNLSVLLLYIFTEYFPISRSTFNISIPDEVINGTGWKLKGGMIDSNVEGFKHWTKHKYRKYLKRLKKRKEVKQ